MRQMVDVIGESSSSVISDAISTDNAWQHPYQKHNKRSSTRESHKRLRGVTTSLHDSSDALGGKRDVRVRIDVDAARYNMWDTASS